MANVEEYVSLLEKFYLEIGIIRQMDAFKGMLTSVNHGNPPPQLILTVCCATPLIHTAGFNRVFPMERLQTFSPHELQLLLCGEQAPSWSRDDLMCYTEPKYGYTKERCVTLKKLVYVHTCT